MTRAEQVTAQALKLPKRSRGQLINELIRSLDGPEDPKAAELWEKEIVRRVKLDELGKLKYVSAKASLVDLRKRIKH